MAVARQRGPVEPQELDVAPGVEASGGQPARAGREGTIAVAAFVVLVECLWVGGLAYAVWRIAAGI